MLTLWSFSLSCIFHQYFSFESDLRGETASRDVTAVEPGNKLPLEELSNSQQIKRENKAEAEPAASTELYSTCQLTDCGQVISSGWHLNPFYIFRVTNCLNPLFSSQIKVNKIQFHLTHIYVSV